jgi:hypothetical protein
MTQSLLRLDLGPRCILHHAHTQHTHAFTESGESSPLQLNNHPEDYVIHNALWPRLGSPVQEALILVLSSLGFMKMLCRLTRCARE